MPHEIEAQTPKGSTAAECRKFLVREKDRLGCRPPYPLKKSACDSATQHKHNHHCFGPKADAGVNGPPKAICPSRNTRHAWPAPPTPSPLGQQQATHSINVKSANIGRQRATRPQQPLASGAIWPQCMRRRSGFPVRPAVTSEPPKCQRSQQFAESAISHHPPSMRTWRAPQDEAVADFRPDRRNKDAPVW